MDKILILQCMIGDQISYFEASKLINKAYATRHGYDYRCETTDDGSDSHIHWQVIRRVRDALIKSIGKYDYILYLDADAFFYGQNFAVEDELVPLLGDKLILFAADCGSESERWHPDKPNAGQMLVRCNNDSADFFTAWTAAETSTPDIHPRSQLGLWGNVLPQWSGKIVVVSDYYRFASRYGLFVRHLYLGSDDDRKAEMEEFLKRIGKNESVDSGKTEAKPARRRNKKTTETE